MNIQNCVGMKVVESSISKDCAMIFEAIRRLIEGTCCLMGEEKECAWDLFHKLYEAFSEHKSFEEKHLFPLLPNAEQMAHEAEHQRLTELMAKCRYELELSEGDRFRSVLSEFAHELKTHHLHDHVSEVLRSGGRASEKLENDVDMRRIAKRTAGSFLD